MIIQYQTVKVDGVNIFYRQAKNIKKPTILLLHGFPSSSHMFRNLIRELGDEYNIIAPDYPGFGNSDQPPIEEFEYTFYNLANVINNFVEEIKLDKYSIYVHNYGAPVGFRLAVKHPERIQAIIIYGILLIGSHLYPGDAPYLLLLYVLFIPAGHSNWLKLFLCLLLLVLSISLW